MVVGGDRSFNVANQSIGKEEIDYIAMARPLILEPRLIQRWQQADTSVAKCISCNGCFKPGLKEGGIYCVVDAKEKKKRL